MVKALSMIRGLLAALLALIRPQQLQVERVIIIRTGIGKVVNQMMIFKHKQNFSHSPIAHYFLFDCLQIINQLD